MVKPGLCMKGSGTGSQQFAVEPSALMPATPLLCPGQVWSQQDLQLPFREHV